MKERPGRIKRWFFPKNDPQIDREIDMLNIKTTYYVSLIVCVVQAISLLVFIITMRKDFGSSQTVHSVFNVSTSILLCVAGFIIAGYFRRQEDLAQRHVAVNLFVGAYVTLLVVWGMMASVQTFIRGEQIITFFTVELIVVIFIKLRPLFTATLVVSSYTAFYILLNVCIRQGMINPYNYFMMGILSVAGAMLIYRITASYIEQKNKAAVLNDSLEIIANHDSTTRLQNRYALNQRIPDYLNTDICLAMLDINDFKTVNDTYGHRAGDDVLKAFSDILLECFGHEEIFRYGGDEFLIVSCTRDRAGFRNKLDEINDRFGALQVGDIKSTFSCSAGSVSVCPQDPNDFFDAVMRADKALYEAKNARKATP